MTARLEGDENTDEPDEIDDDIDDLDDEGDPSTPPLRRRFGQRPGPQPGTLHQRRQQYVAAPEASRHRQNRGSYDPKARPASALKSIDSNRFCERFERYKVRHPHAGTAEAMVYATSGKKAVRKLSAAN